MVNHCRKYLSVKCLMIYGKLSIFFMSLVELDEFNKIKLLKLGRLAQGLSPVTCTTVRHVNHHTKVSSVLV